MVHSFNNVKRLLVLYVGGTIGMQKSEHGYIPVRQAFFRKIKEDPQMHDKIVADKLELNENELVLPKVSKCTLIYKVEEYDVLLDSSNMSSDDWVRIGRDIEKNYNLYDGFIILHGTDTLVYTASALSFMLEGLKKSVILTGSQIPIYETRSDAYENFKSSLILAGCFSVPEVCVFFHNNLFRGNRTIKKSSCELDAFESPNYFSLAIVGIHIKVNEVFIRRDPRPLKVHTSFSKNVALLSFYPTITKEQIKSMLKPPVEGLVLVSYGAGNIPCIRTDLMKVLSDAVDRGVIIVNVTQCQKGHVTAAYEAGTILEKIGIISGGDMTQEAALTKLCFILGISNLSIKDKIKMLQEDLRGELTNDLKDP